MLKPGKGNVQSLPAVMLLIVLKAMHNQNNQRCFIHDPKRFSSRSKFKP